MAFWTAFWDKVIYSDLWMIETTIKTNKTDKDDCFFQKSITHKKYVCPYSLAFFYISLLVCKFKSYKHGTEYL